LYGSSFHLIRLIRERKLQLSCSSVQTTATVMFKKQSQCYPILYTFENKTSTSFSHPVDLRVMQKSR